MLTTPKWAVISESTCPYNAHLVNVPNKMINFRIRDYTTRDNMDAVIYCL
jgi:hypothetical protein